MAEFRVESKMQAFVLRQVGVVFAVGRYVLVDCVEGCVSKVDHYVMDYGHVGGLLGCFVQQGAWGADVGEAG